MAAAAAASGDTEEDLTVEVLAINEDSRGFDVRVLGHFDLPEETMEQFTLCFWMKPTCWSEYSTYLNSDSFWLSLLEGSLAISIVGRFTVLDRITELQAWSHICVCVQGIDIQLFYDGLPVRSSSVQEYSETPDDLIAPRFVNITSSYFEGSTNFCGYFSSLQIFQGLLTKDQIESVRLGNFAEFPFSYYPYKIDDVIPNANEKILTSSVHSEFLKKKFNFSLLVFKVKVTYRQAFMMCTGYGGTLPIIDNVEHREIVKENLSDVQEKGDIWMQMSSRNLSGNLEQQWCPMMYKNKGVFYMIQWGCIKFSVNLMCIIPKGIFLRLKGNALTNENQFAIQQDKSFQGITLESRRNLKGLWKGSSFQIQTKKGDMQFQIALEDGYPIGRRQWHTKDNNTVLLSLSTCSFDEFSCNNGQCIPISQRCDGKMGDCFDLSDEDSTCEIFFGPDETYFKMQAPRDRRVSVDVWMKFIRSIGGDDNTIKVLFQISLSWRDERLRFYNLITYNRSTNILNTKYLEELWNPYLYFLTATYEENLRINTKDMIHKLKITPQKNGTLALLKSFEALEFLGENVIIEMITAVDITVQCNFDFQAFPFDFQLCLIPIKLQGNDHPMIDKETLRVRSDNQALPIYDVYQIRCRHVPKSSRFDRDQVVIAVLIERKNKAFFLTMLGPCIVLEMLGLLSFLAFPIDEFYQRASTCLSLLIVVASIFSQSVSVLPRSASPKAIDVWFFFFILRFFLYFVAHCLVEFQRLRVQKKKSETNIKIIKVSNEEAIRNKALANHSIKSMDSRPTVDADESEDEKGQRKAHRSFAWMANSIPKTTPFHPTTVNLACLLLGIAIDVTFIAIFIRSLMNIRSDIFEEFLKYENCN
ncbi:uncharacterized protein [Palaemon carinicauda]|uniref:uncharacterized protein n=1 Tax=Palaemon carinicauda TaxID=392227 RepID=UPI0035B65338